MTRVLVYSALLLLGLIGSQFLPVLAGEHYRAVFQGVMPLTMVCLAYIMIGVGREFEIDKSNLRQYGWDYVVGATAAAFPWAFCCLYFVYVLVPSEHWGSWPVWKEAMLASRFSAPTSAGVLFSMLAAAGLAATWVFRKARILAIFDDLDTVLLMIPLKMAMVGFRWQLVVIIVVMVALLTIGYRYLHAWKLPGSWKAILGYSVVMVIVVEIAHHLSMKIDQNVPIHVEVLLPAFVLGCVMRHPEGHGGGPDDAPHAEPDEARAAAWISGAFMVLVGLSMPSIADTLRGGGGPEGLGETVAAGALLSVTGPMGWTTIALHVLAVTLLANLGKMFPALCYRREATWRERMAVAVGMWPRGEVGAGVLVISLSYGIGGSVVVIAMLSLALNLALTGVFIWWVKRLLAPSARGCRGDVAADAADRPLE